MTAYNWKYGVNGSWGTKGDWQQDAVPNSTMADVTIASGTDIGVTIAAGQTFAADSVTLGSSAVTLKVAGLLNLGGATDALYVDAGTLDLASGGTIANGTINAGGGVSLASDATLEDITYVGPLNLTASFDSIYVKNGLQVVSSIGGPGTINLTGDDANIYFHGNETLNDVGINLDNGNALIARNGTGSFGNVYGLTFGNTAIVNSNGGFNYIFGGTLVNDGIINAAGGSDMFVTSDTTFTNAGTLNIAAGSDVFITTDVLENTGVINVAAGGELGISETAASDNGVINADGTIQLDYSTSLAGLNSINWGSASQLLVLEGDLNIGGGTLAIGGDDNILIEYGGEVSNGTINSNLGTLTVGNGAVLSDITFIGPINLTPSYDILRIYNGFTLLNSSGDGPGTISLTGLRDQLYFTTTKLDNAVINVTGYFDEVYLSTPIVDNVGINLGTAGQKTLEFLQTDNTTFGSHATINSNGTQNFNSIYQYTTGSVVNDGIINIAGRGLAFNTGKFKNSGTINISAGSEGFVGSKVVNGSYVESTFTNTGLIEGTGAGVSKFTTVPYPNSTPDIKFDSLVHGVLIAGGFEANPGNTLKLDLSGQVITTDDGVLILNGKGSQIKEFQASTDSYVALQSTLRNIGPGGEFEVLGGRDFTTGNKLRITGGTLALGGGTFSAAGLDLALGGSRITGFGTVAKGVTNHGVIEADGGTLVVAGTLQGSGSLRIDAASTLELAKGTSENVAFAGANSGLILEAPSLFTGTLGGIAAGDSIDLAGETASAARISGTKLLVTLSNSTVLDYTLASTLPLEGVSISNSGSGAELTFYQLPAAAAAPAMMFMGPSAAATEKVPLGPAALPPLRQLWSDATQYRPFFTGHFGRASVTNLQHLPAELGNMPTPASAGIVLAGLHNGDVAHILNRDLPFATPMGLGSGHS